jgi:hypothetical protein
MGFLSHLLYPWGLLLQGFAIVHFIRRRPDMYWIFIILFLGPLGALVYIFSILGLSPGWSATLTQSDNVTVARDSGMIAPSVALHRDDIPIQTVKPASDPQTRRGLLEQTTLPRPRAEADP